MGLQALENAGFSDVTEFLTTLYTHKFTADTECSAIQAKEWASGIPRTLSKISEHSLAAYRRPYDMKPFRKAVTNAAKQVYKKKLTRFNTKPDNCSANKHGKKDAGPASERPWFQMSAEDADSGFLGTDVIKQTQLEMETGIPYLWGLFTDLASSKTRSTEIFHVTALSLSMLSYTAKESLRKVQTVIGVYLYSNSVPNHVISMLQTFGLSVGKESLKLLLDTLAAKQVARLKANEAGLEQDVLEKALERPLFVRYTREEVSHWQKATGRRDVFVATLVGGANVEFRKEYRNKLDLMDPTILDVTKIRTRAMSVPVDSCSEPLPEGVATGW